MLSIVVPLYGAAVGLGVAEIGLVVAARSVLPTALSIHGGILMDRLGTRRVLVWLAVACALLPLLYPLSGWFAMLFVLQLLLGLASSLSMAAAQTWSLQVSGGDMASLAKFSVVSRIGTFVGPVVVGAAWDLFGAGPICLRGAVRPLLWLPRLRRRRLSAGEGPRYGCWTVPRAGADWPSQAGDPARAIPRWPSSRSSFLRTRPAREGAM